jgi:hypothetical protein
MLQEPGPEIRTVFRHRELALYQDEDPEWVGISIDLPGPRS